jgi:hypothetical protein
VAFDAARRNLVNAQQKLASLNQQPAAIAANLNGDPDGPVEKHPRYLDAVAQRNEAQRSLFATHTQINHAEIAQHVTSVNRMFEHPMITQFWNPATAAGRAALDAVVTREAQIIAYIDDYKLLMMQRSS